MSEIVRCKRCRRVLSQPESKRRGYGEVCWNKVQHIDPNVKEIHKPVTRKTLLEIYGPTTLSPFVETTSYDKRSPLKI